MQQAVGDPIDSRYAVLGGATGPLGNAVGARVTVAGGQAQAYEHGHISWSASTGAWETLAAVDGRHQAIAGPASALGFPTGAPMAFGSGQWQWFTGGVIWWNAESGAWETLGPIHVRYNAIGGPWRLGFPTSAPMAFGSGQWQWFTGGVVWWSPATGAWETTGGIHQQYNAMSGPWSWYGFPVGPQYAYLGGVRQDFVGGSLLSGVTVLAQDATLSGVSAADVWATWRSGCPVGPESLTLVRLNYWGFDNAVHRGEIIVRSDLAGRVAAIFDNALAQHYPIRKMWRVDYYGGDDPAAMADDNTSGFNCRQVTGGTGLSPHSYGIAIDINTVENPYYAGGRWWPTTEYVDRGVLRWGMLYGWSDMTRVFTDYGYSWGGSYLDYQHFQFVG